MTADEFIERALKRGTSMGLSALGPVDQVVFAISEAEITCMIDGIDNLIERYGLGEMPLFADAFAAVGAVDIAMALRAIAQSPQPVADRLLALANDLINGRVGYDYESVAAYVTART